MSNCSNNLSVLTESLFVKKKSPEIDFLIDLLDKIQENIIIVDINSTIVFVNESYVQTFNIKKEKIIGKQLRKFEPLARIHDVLKTGQALTGEISHIYSSKKDVYADIIPLFSGKKQLGAMALMRDVTEIQRINDDLEHYKSFSHSLKQELVNKSALPEPFQKVIGQDFNFVNMLHTAARAARSTASICIQGESGTGKEVLAEAIHKSSPRANEPLIKINCAAIPENLLESELFGYEPGSFTGARSQGKPGKFELANKGTIFLDEIGELPLSMQVKLLRVLQERKVERLGSSKSIDSDFRLITATNRNLEQMIESGDFREDLYYRINVINLVIPPLRERINDTKLFAQFFLDELKQKYNCDYRLSKEAMDAIISYHWPGNVRELKNYIERAAILSVNEVIDIEHLPEKTRQSLKNNVASPNSSQLKTLYEQTEKDAILHALKICGGNKSRAMEMLGISRRSFYQKINKYNLLNK